MDLKSGQVIAGWSLEDFLGEGGNAEVWRCSRHSDVAAVKFLKTRKVDSQAWARFVGEVEFVRSLGARNGILPVLDSALPQEGPVKGDRAWYSMPVATPLAAAIADAPLDTVVDAVATIADTLAAVFAEHQVAHRDIKPGNLYLFEETYCIGDWGLLWHEGRAGLTAANEITGPLSFTAPELFRALNEGEVIDYQASDVFSLAKTLWALARGSQWAVPGQHRVEDSVGAFRPHPRSATLDRLLVRATDPDPAHRPKMTEFASELHSWGLLSSEPGPIPSLGDIGESIRDRFMPIEERERPLREISLHFNYLVNHADQQLAEFYAEIDRSIPRVRVGVRDGVVLDSLIGNEYLGGPRKLHQYGTAIRLSDQAEVLERVLEMGLVIEIWDNDTTRVGAGFFFGRVEELGGAGADSLGPSELETGTVAEITAIDEAVAWLVAHAPKWLRRFSDAINQDA